MKRIAFNTLGCRLNQYETDALVSEFRDSGYEIAEWGDMADAYVINTCTVTEKSDRKCRALIYQALRAQEQAAHAQTTNGPPEKPVILVTGCFVENPHNGFAGDERITYTVDSDKKSAIFGIVDGHLRGNPVDITAIPGDRFAFLDSTKGFHTRSSVKVQDGCDNHCTFCIIPKVRGRAVSRPLGKILRQVSESLASGAKEIVVTGVNIGSYRDGTDGFSEMLKAILEIDGDFRVRVSSIEPEGGWNGRGLFWERGFVELLHHRKLCPHLHLCLQSGSDKILKAMGRRYSVVDFLKTVEVIREKRPDFNFTTDVMVGFPGEGEEDFLATLDVIEKAGFSHIHTFPFSARPGTAASRMEGQVPEPVKLARAKQVRDISSRQKRLYREGFLGKVQKVLVETVADGVGRGYGEHYIPVEFSAPAANAAEDTRRGLTAAGSRINTIVPVKIESIDPEKEAALRGSTILSSQDARPR